MTGLPLRGQAAVVGVAESDLGDVGPDRYAIELAAQAVARTLEDAGLRTADVDGLFGVVAGRLMSTLDLGEYLGIRPRYTDSTMIGGSAFVAHLHHAALAIAAGRCEVALIAYGSTPRADSGRGRLAAASPELPNFEAMYRPRSPVSGYALAAIPARFALEQHDWKSASQLEPPFQEQNIGPTRLKPPWSSWLVYVSSGGISV